MGIVAIENILVAHLHIKDLKKTAATRALVADHTQVDMMSLCNGDMMSLCNGDTCPPSASHASPGLSCRQTSSSSRGHPFGKSAPTFC